MPYENPEDYIEEEKRRHKMLEKALKLAKIKSTEEEPTEMDSEDIVEAAEKFDDFISKK